MTPADLYARRMAVRTKNSKTYAAFDAVIVEVPPGDYTTSGLRRFMGGHMRPQASISNYLGYLCTIAPDFVQKVSRGVYRIAPQPLPQLLEEEVGPDPLICAMESLEAARTALDAAFTLINQLRSAK